VKVELTVVERSYVANLLRRRSMEAQHNRDVTKSDRQRVEFEEEARIAESLAIRFDDGEDLQLEQKTPIIPSPNRDINYLEERTS